MRLPAFLIASVVLATHLVVATPEAAAQPPSLVTQVQPDP